MQVIFQILAIFAVLMLTKFLVLGVLDTLRAVAKSRPKVIRAMMHGALVGAAFGLLAATQRADASVPLYVLAGASCVALGQVYAALAVAMYRNEQMAADVYHAVTSRYFGRAIVLKP